MLLAIHALPRLAFGTELLEQHLALFGTQRVEPLEGILQALTFSGRHCLEFARVRRRLKPLLGRHLRPAGDALLNLGLPLRWKLPPFLDIPSHALLASGWKLIPLRLQRHQERALLRA